jgi:hypothetical protein
MMVVRHLGVTDDEWARTVADARRHGYFMDAEQPGADEGSRRDALLRRVNEAR